LHHVRDGKPKGNDRGIIIVGEEVIHTLNLWSKGNDSRWRVQEGVTTKPPGRVFFEEGRARVLRREGADEDTKDGGAGEHAMLTLPWTRWAQTYT